MTRSILNLSHSPWSGWKVEKDKMKGVCLQCHGKSWVYDNCIKPDKEVMFRLHRAPDCLITEEYGR
jgi:hypothetical protein